MAQNEDTTENATTWFFSETFQLIAAATLKVVQYIYLPFFFVVKTQLLLYVNLPSKFIAFFFLSSENSI